MYFLLTHLLDRNQHPIVDEKVVEPLTFENSNEYAVVTGLYTDAFATAVATLGHTLNAANSTAARILLYLPERVSPRALCVATASGFRPHAVARIPPPHAGVHRHFLDQYSKLRLWTLDTIGVRALVYLDADTLVRRNFDELFSLPYAFAAVPDVFLDSRAFASSFNAGVLFLRPDSAVFEDMLPKIATAAYPAEDAEQSFLNHYFGMQALRLPYAYNANLAIKKRQPEMWRHLMAADVRIVHYTLVKPFLTGDYAEVEMEKLDKNVESKKRARGGAFVEEVEEWGRAWRQTRRLYGDVFDQCRSAT
ncbi:nucleotide-diphospho-sugar transferase [Sparassis latifolia]